MKSFLFLAITFLFSIAISAQETTTDITRTSDTTFIQTNITTYDDGRIVTEQIPFDLDGFANLIADENIKNLIKIERREKANTTAQRDVNQLKNYLIDSLDINYDSLFAQKLLLALNGSWKLLEKNGSTTITNVSIAEHSSNPSLLRMTNEDGPGGWNLKNLSTHSWEIRNYDVGGTPEIVEMTLTQFQNLTGYRGRASDGTTIILRR